MTVHGFFSVVKKGGTPALPVYAIRARKREHLQALSRACEDAKLVTGPLKIKQSTMSDYPFRANVSERLWGGIARMLADGVDYENFKSAAQERLRGSDAAYVDFLHDVWSLGFGLEGPHTPPPF